MPTRNIFRKAGTAFIKNSPNSIGLQFNSTTNAFTYLDGDDATLKTLWAAPAPSAAFTTATLTLTAAMNGRTTVATLGSGTSTFTLPLAATYPGYRHTFICGDAAGEILITPNAADQISAKGLVDHSTSVKPTAGTGIKNTAATNVLGDHITLISDGVNTWHELSGAGIWASQ